MFGQRIQFPSLSALLSPLIIMKRKFHDFVTLLMSIMLMSIVQLVERRTGVPEDVSSNPARVNSFSVDNHENHETFPSCFSEDDSEIDNHTCTIFI